MTYDNALACIKRIEEDKAKYSNQSAVFLAAKKITKENQGPLQELAKIKSFDQLFFDTGAEEEDLTTAMTKFQIT